MKTRAIILLLLLLLPLVPAMTQEHEEFEAIPMTYQKKNPSFNGVDANDFSKWVNEHKNYPEEAKKGKPADVTYTFPVIFKLTDLGPYTKDKCR